MKKQKKTAPQASSSTEFAPQEFGVPVTGWGDKDSAAPEGYGVKMGEAGPGISNTRPGIR